MNTFFATYGFLLVSMLLAAILALSLYLPLMAGQLSLASPGFYALGGYIAAIISTKLVQKTDDSYILRLGGSEIGRWAGASFPLNFPLSVLLAEMLLAAIASALLAVVIGVPALRLRGIYLALATIAFVEILRVLSLNLEITGGAIGIFNVPQPFGSQIAYMWIVAPLLVLSIAFTYRLERIRAGRAFTAIREDELAAAAMGIDPTRYKVLAFTLGAMLAGMAGAISAHFLNTWNARQGTFDASIGILAFVLIGGSRTFLGAVMGGLVLTALPEILRAVSDIEGLAPAISILLKEGRLIIYGLLIVIGSIFFPQGLITPRLLNRFKRRTAIASQSNAVVKS